MSSWPSSASGSRVTARLELRHPAGRTTIRVGAGALDEPAPEVAAAIGGKLVFLVTSPAVAGLHAGRLAALEARAREWRRLDVPDGEEAKRLEVAQELWREMLEAGGKRDSSVVAFGGGTVGDLAGFVAAGFLRGIDYVQVPTTLLAQVDASVGGKTAVNLPEAKNSVGFFHHPAGVICDTSLLATLEPAELRSGLFEVVKIGAIQQPALLDAVAESLPRLLEGDAGALAPIVAAAVAAKIEVVEADPSESDRRRLLNFGHTLGHALESVFGYRGLRHGEAVGYGMLFALRLAERRGLDAAAARRVRELIRRIGLPPLGDFAIDELLERTARDKKARETGLAWVYPRALGDGRIDAAIDPAEIRATLAEFAADPWAG